MVLATALQNYGAIQRATGGPPSRGIILYAEQAAETETTSQLANMRSDFVRIQPYLRVMRNQASNTVNGGGTPLQPMQPASPRASAHNRLALCDSKRRFGAPLQLRRYELDNR